MKLKEIIDRLELKVAAGENLDREVAGGYASDLLSDVMANSREGDIWVTLQAHPNIIAVASLKGMAGVVIVQGRTPEAQTVEKARQEDIPLMVTGLQTFELVGRLYSLGVSGTR
jgi:hypothetical protein